MQLVEQHCIKKSDPRSAAIDAAAFASKNCYQALPSKVSNSILILIDKNWRAFRHGLKAWFDTKLRPKRGI